MSEVRYDIAKLKQLCEIDVDRAIRNYRSNDEFFKELTVFTQRAGFYLMKNNPLVIIHSEDARREFITELDKISASFDALGITSETSRLEALEDAVYEKDKEKLTRLVAGLNTSTESLSKLIVSTKATSSSVSYQAKYPSEKKIILALDDKPELLSTVVEMLRDQFMVMAVTTGDAALRIIEKFTPSLFLLDIQMPQMDGYQFASLIRRDERFEKTPIIFLTSKGERSDIINAVKHGGNDYIIKPADKDVLINKLYQYLE